MLFKREYKVPEGWVKELNVKGEDGKLKNEKLPEGICLNPPPLDYVFVAHTGTTRAQNFSTRLVLAAVREGWMKVEPGKITLLVKPEHLAYAVKRAPGRYCLHCKEKLADDNFGMFARAHVEEKHAGKESPDPTNPAGYEMLNHYECELEEAQHEKYRVKDPTHQPKFPRRPRGA